MYNFSKFRLPLEVVLISVLSARAFGTEHRFDEYEVKAVFLINFARFVEWPHEAFSGVRDPLTICVWQPDPFGTFLTKAAQRQTAVGRNIEIRDISGSREVNVCHVLFVRSFNLRGDASAVGKRFVLAVSEKGSDADSRAAINFVTDRGRIRFEVDLGNVERTGLRLKSQLLALATAVKK